MRILFAGTASFALPSFKVLLGLEHKLVGVITQPDRPRGRGLKPSFSPIKEVALRSNLSVLQPENLKDEKAKKKILDLKPDLTVVAAYGKILPKWMFEEIKYGAINIHASLLPEYRGAAPIERAIMNGERKTGITIIQMDEGLDTGDILLQRSIPIGDDETSGEVTEKLAELGAAMILEVVALIEQGRLKRIKQVAEGTYAEKVAKEEAQIDWSWGAEKIHNLIRALNPHPGAHTFYKGIRVKIWRSQIREETTPPRELATIISIDNQGFTVNCGGGTLSILEVQPENKRKMTAAEFGRGYRLEVGEALK